jgi:hypothetical protein
VERAWLLSQEDFARDHFGVISRAKVCNTNAFYDNRVASFDTIQALFDATRAAFRWPLNRHHHATPLCRDDLGWGGDTLARGFGWDGFDILL